MRTGPRFANDTIKRNPNETTSPKPAARALIKRDIGVPVGSAFQMTLSAVCISPNTPEAVTITMTTPITVAILPEVLSCALATAVCRSSALCWPIRPLS